MTLQMFSTKGSTVTEETNSLNQPMKHNTFYNNSQAQGEMMIDADGRLSLGVTAAICTLQPFPWNPDAVIYSIPHLQRCVVFHDSPS